LGCHLADAFDGIEENLLAIGYFAQFTHQIVVMYKYSLQK